MEGVDWGPVSFWIPKLLKVWVLCSTWGSFGENPGSFSRRESQRGGDDTECPQRPEEYLRFRAHLCFLLYTLCSIATGAPIARDVWETKLLLEKGVCCNSHTHGHLQPTWGRGLPGSTPQSGSPFPQVRPALPPCCSRAPSKRSSSPPTQLHLRVLREQHVLPLDVPVDHLVRVEVSQSLVGGKRREVRPCAEEGAAGLALPARDPHPSAGALTRRISRQT